MLAQPCWKRRELDRNAITRFHAEMMRGDGQQKSTKCAPPSPRQRENPHEREINRLTKTKKEVLLNQIERGIKTGDWPEAEATITREDFDYHLKIESARFVFLLTRNQRFKGIFNYQE